MGWSCLRHVQRYFAGAGGHCAGGRAVLRRASPLTVRWAAGDTVALTGFDVSVSFNNGTSYTRNRRLHRAAGVAPVTARGRRPVRRARQSASVSPPRRRRARPRSSETTFNLVTPSITDHGTPRSAQFAGTTSNDLRGSTTAPRRATVRIELSRDGGGSYETLRGRGAEQQWRQHRWQLRLERHRAGHRAARACQGDLERIPARQLAAPATSPSSYRH